MILVEWTSRGGGDVLFPSELPVSSSFEFEPCLVIDRVRSSLKVVPLSYLVLGLGPRGFLFFEMD